MKIYSQSRVDFFKHRASMKIYPQKCVAFFKHPTAMKIYLQPYVAFFKHPTAMKTYSQPCVAFFKHPTATFHLLADVINSCFKNYHHRMAILPPPGENQANSNSVPLSL